MDELLKFISQDFINYLMGDEQELEVLFNYARYLYRTQKLSTPAMMDIENKLKYENIFLRKSTDLPVREWCRKGDTY